MAKLIYRPSIYGKSTIAKDEAIAMALLGKTVVYATPKGNVILRREDVDTAHEQSIRADERGKVKKKIEKEKRKFFKKYKTIGLSEALLVMGIEDKLSTQSGDKE